ncbi:polysaccharide biosynthesis protein [Prosthecochloris sp. GSB1]|uniref:oligosaccharide flippase family protein n=1 Tax=Prosthecochloris sp. GSB1 TaxID=281093 RepID=UPI000B8C7CB4|nr:oligosaccharide flippase family protein [Prosthecochloris sp. GSB1]ASQ91361.1 polysaccharide biosynthesis protein [Prosthecochloris sp. GSB1]
MKRKMTIVRQAGFSFSGFIAGQGLRFLFNIAVAGMLGARYLGVYALALAVLQIVEVLAAGGLDAAVLRFVNLHEDRPEEQRAHIASAVKASFLRSVPLALLLMLASWPLASLLHGDRLLAATLFCYACSLPFTVFTAVAGHAIQAYRNLRPKIVATQIIVPGGMLLLVVALNRLSGGTVALVSALPLASAAAGFWIWRELRQVTGLLPADVFSAGMSGELSRYARPLLFVALTAMTSHWLDILMLGWYADAGTVGLYQPAVRTAGLVRAVLIAFAGIVSPMFAGLHARGETGELERLFRITTRWVLLAALPPAVVLLVMPEAVLSLFGPGFISASTVLLVLTAAVLVQSLFGLCDTLLQMTGYAKASLAIAGAALAAHAILNAALIPRYGMLGAAFALFGVYLLAGAARAFALRSLLGVHPFGTALFKPVLAAVCSGLVLTLAAPLLGILPVPVLPVVSLLLVLGVYAIIVRLLQLEQEEKEVIFELLPFLKR